jgi:hypothetical protein
MNPSQGAKRAWNYIDRDLDLGTPWRAAAVAAQSKLGLRSDRRIRADPRDRSHSSASRPHLTEADLIETDLSEADLTEKEKQIVAAERSWRGPTPVLACSFL